MREDLRHAIRMLIKDGRTSVLIVVILALGIGANASVFSLLEATVLDPFPYQESDRLVEVVRGFRQRFSGPFNYRAFAALRGDNEIFSGVAGYRAAPLTIAIDGEPEPAMGTEVSAGVFDVLGVAPLLGRGFTADEEGSAGASVAVLSHHLWETRYASDANILGRTIRVDSEDRTIIGVMPPGFGFYQAAVVWIPLRADAFSSEDDDYRFGVIARLRDDVDMTRAAAAMETMRESLEPFFGEPSSDIERPRAEFPLRIATLREGWNPAGMQYFGALFQVAAGFVLLVACANLASLFLARGVARQRELSIRQALGAPRHRLVRQLFTENVLFAAFGGVLGLIVTVWGRELLRMAFPSRALVGIELELNLGVVAFVAGVSGFAAIAFGMLPALELSKIDLERALREWSVGATGPRRIRRRERALAVVQIAMSLMLLIGATITARSLTALQRVDPGFDAHAVYEVFLSFGNEYDNETRGDETKRIADALDGIAAIEAVALEGFPGAEVIGSIRDRRTGFVETAAGPSALSARVVPRAVNEDYFTAFGLSLMRGRTFDETDRPGAPLVVVVSERAARIMWPDDDPIGKTIRYPGSELRHTVIGVVSNKVRVTSSSYDRSEFGMRAEAWPDVYLSASQHNAIPSTLFWVRPRVNAATLAQDVRTTTAAVAPNVPMTFVRTVWEGQYEPDQFVYRSAAQVLGVLSVIAILLSALGTYSVIAFAWAQRAREIGVRVALGARTRDVMRLVIGQGQRIAFAGIAGGTLVSLALYRFASGMFFGVSSWDPITYAGAALLLLIMATVAGLVPARRAARTDPNTVLRQE